MKLTILVENTSLYSRGSFYSAEHGFSAWLEDEDIKVLFDCGYSDNFIKNAEQMGINVMDADYVILSHCHWDHTGGLKHLMKYYREHGMARKPVLMFSSNEIFNKRFEFNWSKSTGLDVSRAAMDEFFEVRVCPEPVRLTKNLVYMGITERTNDFEHVHPQTTKILRDGVWCDDCVDEDTQIAYKHKNGQEVSVVGACAHYGICNIMEYAKKLTNTHQINTYVGGSHLRIDEVPQSQLDSTCAYVKSQNIQHFYICHDTDLHCKLALWNTTPCTEAGTSLVLECE